MHNILIIAKREYLERVRTRSFVIMTLFIPLLMFGLTAVPTMLANRRSDETKRMVVVAGDRDTAEMIRSRIEQKQEQEKSAGKSGLKLRQKRSLPPTNFTVEISTNAADSERAALTAQVKDKKLDAFLWATPDAIKAGKLDFVTNDVSSFIDNGFLGIAVNDALRRSALKSKGLKDEDIEASLQSVEVAPQSPLGKNAPNPQMMFIATLGMVMVMYVTVLLYGVNVMRSILEEKTSRIMEVMLSTASAKDLMAGKILGVGAVGLTQVGIWALTAGIFSSSALVASADLIKGVLSVKLLLYFGVFFLLGYVLYSTLCAAVGSMVNSEQEAQQMQFLVMMPMILSVIFIVNIFQHPSSTIAIFGSLFPFTAPLVMFSRIAIQPETPVWQIAASIALMIATIYGMVVLCGRIYRVGILMYGKKPNLPEIMKWIKYA
ncbi:MAG TPA: ABC transporter permease [Candidatus Angelobacter sp.]|nr:ABC transporter permease [Candidatus Angelobacter sp.]